MTDYTSLPIFLNQTVPPNVLFLADMGNPTLEAAYSGSNHKYAISFKAGAATSGAYAANVTVDSQTGADLVAVNSSGVPIPWATVSAPADVFDATSNTMARLTHCAATPQIRTVSILPRLKLRCRPPVPIPIGTEIF